MTITIYILAFSVLNCDKEEKFPSCPMPDQLKEDCKKDGVSCAVTLHPQCPDNVCLIYKYTNITMGEVWLSGPFCTLECASHTDCPSDSTCLDYLEKKYCVPNRYLQ